MGARARDYIGETGRIARNLLDFFHAGCAICLIGANSCASFPLTRPNTKKQPGMAARLLWQNMLLLFPRAPAAVPLPPGGVPNRAQPCQGADVQGHPEGQGCPRAGFGHRGGLRRGLWLGGGSGFWGRLGGWLRGRRRLGRGRGVGGGVWGWAWGLHTVWGWQGVGGGGRGGRWGREPGRRESRFPRHRPGCSAG